MKDASEIREMLIERLQISLQSPAMCGGELGILNLLEYITFIDERENEWKSYRRKLYESGAFRSTGIPWWILGCNQTNEKK